MQAARFVLTPYYEIMDSIMPLRRLFLDECASLDTHGRLRGRQMVDFNIRYEHSLLLSESKRQKMSSFNVRSVIRFCKADEMRCDEYGIRVKDAFPLHLNIDLNNTLISLPNLLPNDRFGKDGRRFPRPVDLSEGLIENPIITNRMYITWVQDESRRDEYYFAMYLVRLRSCEELTSLLLSQHISTVKTTLGLVYDQCVNLNGAVDDDLMLVNTSIHMSLICPVSRSRMHIPIRGQQCNHLQCFDCMTYLIMNFKKPSWLCPVCDKKTFFCYVEVDGLIFSILKDERSQAVEQIQFNKSGQWRPMNKIKESASDDRPYFDITDYIKQNKEESSAKISPATNECIADYKIDNYLSQLLNCSKTRMSPLAHNPQPPSSILNHLAHSFHPSVSNVNTPMMVHHPPSSISQNVDHLPASLAPGVLKACYEKMMKNYGIRTSLCSNQFPLPKVTSSVPLNDAASKIQITNVTSIINQSKKDRHVIVLSDDEDVHVDGDKSVNNNSLPKHAAASITKASQKRPMMAASVPSEMSWPKKPTLISRPHSTSTHNTRNATRIQSPLCLCTPGRICPIHIDQFYYFNKLMSDNYPTVTVANHSHETDMVTSSTVPPHRHNAAPPHPSTILNDKIHQHNYPFTIHHNASSHSAPVKNAPMPHFGSLQMNSPTEPQGAARAPGAKSRDSAGMAGPQSTQESLQAQWAQLINSCPMPYADKRVLCGGNISLSGRLEGTAPPINPRELFYGD